MLDLRLNKLITNNIMLDYEKQVQIINRMIMDKTGALITIKKN